MMIVTSGIYAIQRKGSDECYIGSAVNIARRWLRHRGDLSVGTHHSRRMQRVHDKCGMAVLEFVVLEPVADKALLTAREQVWIDRFSPAYNSATVAGSCLGVKASDETRAKISAAGKGITRNLGLKHTPERNAAKSARMIGHTINVGRKQTPEHIAARVAAHTGRKNTPETIAKMSAAAKGRKCAPFTPQHRANLSASLMGNTRTLGHKHSAESLARMSVSGKGRKKTQEHRDAIGAAVAAAARAKRAAA